MYEAAAGVYELFRTYQAVGFTEDQALYLAGCVAFAVSNAMYQDHVREEGANQARAMLIKVAQDQAERLAERLRPRQWQVPPEWPGQSPSPADPYAERVAEMRRWGLLPRGVEQADPYAGLEPVTCGLCGLAVPMDISGGMIQAAASLIEECRTGIGHTHRFPGPKMSCAFCGGPLVEDDGRMVCPDHPSPPPQLGGMP